VNDTASEQDTAPGLSDAGKSVLDLLEYMEEVERLKAKPAFTVPVDVFARFQHEMSGLPELRLNQQGNGDDLWCVVPRLQEIAAPDPGERLAPWIEISKSPDKEPGLKRELVTYESNQETQREALSAHPEIQAAFDWYVENQWRPWAEGERPRRQTISTYNRLFAVQQEIATGDAENSRELVWGIGVAIWRRGGPGTSVRYPLVVQSCELTLNERTFDLEVRPRDVEPRLEIGCYAELDVPGVVPLDAFWKAFVANGETRINPFDAASYEPLLKAAVSYLDSSGRYEAREDGAPLPDPTDKLQVTSNWVMFARKRTGDIFVKDIQELRAAVKELEERGVALPAVVRGFVEMGADIVKVREEVPFRGLSTSEAPAGARELYFPMPYNDEQVSIVQKLEANDGVVVQGPPGTGKTHTIANVICHYLAQGKRVLVTSKGETALAVLQEKLPEEIRPLAVAMLSEEREGMKQFELAIQTIAARVEALLPGRLTARIAELENEVGLQHAKIAALDGEIGKLATSHMRQYTFQGRTVTAADMAKLVLEQMEQHSWFDDRPESGESLPFGEPEIARLRAARARVAGDIGYLGKALPAKDSFPDWPQLLTLHRDIVRAREIDGEFESGDLAPLVDSKTETFEAAEKLLKFLGDYLDLANAVDGSEGMRSLARRFYDLPEHDPVLRGLLSACKTIEALEERRKALVADAIQVPDGAERNPDFMEAIGRLLAGKSAFGFPPFGKAEARKLVPQVTVLGTAPTTIEGWRKASTLLAWRTEASQVLARWAATAAEFDLTAPTERLEEGIRALAASVDEVENVRELVFEIEPELAPRVTEVFGERVADEMTEKGAKYVEFLCESLRAHLDHGRLAYAMKRVGALVQLVKESGGLVVERIGEFLRTRLGDGNADEAALREEWLELMVELARVNASAAPLAEIAEVAESIEAAGAPLWAARLRSQPAGETDKWLPSTWFDAWNWRLAYLFLEKIDAHERMRKLFEERQRLTSILARRYQELVAEKTWLGVYQNSPPAIRQALQAYLNAVQAMGAGTGIRAIRHRRSAREAMKRAYMAVPCWVLPQWRVSETIPPEIGLFDLVVIDEASQSDIWALPSLLRGKKLLVVGDHKQVSPAAVGVAEQKILDLYNRFLRDQAHGQEMTPDKSIYDLARVVFAGNSVMLREHFRCVPTIIEFSNRMFYGNKIVPLRIPKANERLDPPLVDVYVRGGYRDKDTNPAEGQAIVNEILAIVEDPDMAGRSIGAVTLMGTDQAKLIHSLVARMIPPEAVVNHKIAVGAPPAFQGRERDIMMISMVYGAGDRGMATITTQEQRVNVALSRARDRMYLFRSVDRSAFGERTLLGEILRHYRQPFSQDARRVEELRLRCESGFEIEMFDELSRRGYRVQPQVPCGGFRIDFVVEGAEGRRLAIECDGDAFHGPGRWADDMARQRVLERAGWTFWRCFASTFARRRDEVLDDLEKTLAALGIEPLGSESVDSTPWIETREVDPFGVGPASGEEALDRATNQGGST
jgi:very-short-patch-repair endonuclease